MPSGEGDGSESTGAIQAKAAAPLADFLRTESDIGELAEPTPPGDEAEPAGEGTAGAAPSGSASRASAPKEDAPDSEQAAALNGAKRYQAKGGVFVSEALALPRTPRAAADSSVHTDTGGAGGGRDTSVHSTRGMRRRSVSRLGLIRVDSSMHSAAGRGGGDDSVRGDISVHTQASLTPSWSRAKGWFADLSIRDPSLAKAPTEGGADGAAMLQTIAHYVLSQGKMWQKSEHSRGGAAARQQIQQVGFLRPEDATLMPLAVAADNSNGLASLIAGPGTTASAPTASPASQALLFTMPVEKEVESLINHFMEGLAPQTDEQGKKGNGIGSFKQLLGSLCGTVPALNGWLEDTIEALNRAKDGTDPGEISVEGVPGGASAGAGDRAVTNLFKEVSHEGKVAAGWCSVVGAKLLFVMLLDASNVLLRGAAQVELLPASRLPPPASRLLPPRPETDPPWACACPGLLASLHTHAPVGLLHLQWPAPSSRWVRLSSSAPSVPLLYQPTPFRCGSGTVAPIAHL